jgi:DNA excision repair protein ERCC-4
VTTDALTPARTAVPPKAPLTILVDTREQRPPPFPKGVLVEREMQVEGDYTTRFLCNVARIERKSASDFYGSITHDRARFMREVERLKRFPHRVIVVEGDLGDLVIGATRSSVSPNAVVGTMASLYARHGLPVLFAHSPVLVGRLIAGILSRLEEERGACPRCGAHA